MTADTTLHLVRTFRADRSRVFRAFTDPEQLRAWFCPDGFTFTTLRVDRPTGRATDFVMENARTGERYAFTLEYRAGGRTERNPVVLGVGRGLSRRGPTNPVDDCISRRSGRN